MTWMIYGASGFTGTLVAEEAVRRGHRPLLAGRSAARLQPLALRLGLDYAVFSLDDPDEIAKYARRVNLILHAAGPFVVTSKPMLRACLLSGAHYLDLTGEYPVFENTFAHDALARQQGIALISGVGFDVIPSDSLAVQVASQVPGATRLDLAFDGLTRMSAGTVHSGLQLVASGGRVRRDGRLRPFPVGQGARRIRFENGEKTAIPIPWGDLVTAYHSTSIPNITTYAVVPGAAVLGIIGPAAQMIVAQPALRHLAARLIVPFMRGPDAHRRQTARACFWARASDNSGNVAEAWLETVEPYQFTGLSAVLAVERVLADHPVGALTPAQAFGPDFVLQVEGTRFYPTLSS